MGVRLDPSSDLARVQLLPRGAHEQPQNLSGDPTRCDQRGNQHDANDTTIVVILTTVVVLRHHYPEERLRFNGIAP